MNDNKDAPKQVVASQDEINNILQLPGIFVNHFYATPSAGMIRIVLAEKVGDDASGLKVPRTSIVLGYNGLIELHNLISNIIQQINLQAQQQQQIIKEREKLN